MVIQLPDDIAASLKHLAAMHHKSVEEVAIERLRDSLSEPLSSPADLLSKIRSIPHVSSMAVDDLEAAIVQGRIQVDDKHVF